MKEDLKASCFYNQRFNGKCKSCHHCDIANCKEDCCQCDVKFYCPDYPVVVSCRACHKRMFLLTAIAEPTNAGVEWEWSCPECHNKQQEELA